MLSGTYQSLINADDRMAFHVFQNLAAQAVLAGTAAVALPRLGIAGAGVAALAAPVFMFVTSLVSLRYQQGVRVTREAAQMCLVVAAILIACGAIGGRYLGFSAQTLAAKAAMCGAAWGVAYLAMPASDRLRLRSGVLATAHRLLRKRSPDIA